MLMWWRPNSLQRTIGAAIGLLLALARIAPTPPQRVYAIEPESRVMTIEQENRIYSIPGGD